jgi:3-oxoadipate enol-lactonase
VPKIVTNGILTHFQRMEAKDPTSDPPPTVVFIHGLGTDSLASFYLTLAAPVAAVGVDVIAYDLRAHGRTERPATGYRVGDFVDDLGELLDELRIRHPVHLVGNSFGGTIAFSYAVQRPERVASIVAIEAEPATEPWADKMGRTLSNTVAELSKEETFSWISDTFGSHHARLARAAGQRLRSTSMEHDVPSGPLLDLDGLQSIRCPVLAVLGEEGFQKDDLTALQAVLPRCRTQIIHGQNHSVLVESHRTVRALLLRWLAEHGGADLFEADVA